MADPIEEFWKAVPEDTVGGWCIVLEEEQRLPSEGATPFVDLILTEEIAAHVASVHNAWLASHPGHGHHPRHSIEEVLR